MPRKRTKLSEQMRRLILESHKSRYQLWKETGIDQATLSKFVHGKLGLSMAAWDKLAEALDLELRPRTG